MKHIIINSFFWGNSKEGNFFIMRKEKIENWKYNEKRGEYVRTSYKVSSPEDSLFTERLLEVARLACIIALVAIIAIYTAGGVM